MEFAVNKNEEAIELFEKALKTNSKAIPVNLNLAIGYQSIGNFKKAIDHLTKINELDENLPGPTKC